MKIKHCLLVIYIFGLLMILAFCQHKVSDSIVKEKNTKTFGETRILPADYRIDQYLPLLKYKRVGVVVHPSSKIENQFLVDTLQELKVNITKIFAPEHGFRGDADAGEHINSEIDHKSGIRIISLYGKNKKPSSEDLSNVDIVLFDLQDVGVRFYTYLSTLHYVMEACAEHKKKLVILDRPNPNGHYVDGPVLEDDCKSFIGMHPIPIVHGLTLGELAKMIKGENWIQNASQLDLKIILSSNYKHNSRYILPVKPSPNLPNELSILLYPSTCLFEGTVVSLGRGTVAPFQIYGHPEFVNYDTSFTPQSLIGAKNPPLLNKLCKAYSLRNLNIDSLRNNPGINLSYLIESYKNITNKQDFFLKNNFIDLLIGNKRFREQINSNQTEINIKKSWEFRLDEFRKIRRKYLLYN